MIMRLMISILRTVCATNSLDFICLKVARTVVKFFSMLLFLVELLNLETNLVTFLFNFGNDTCRPFPLVQVKCNDLSFEGGRRRQQVWDMKFFNCVQRPNLFLVRHLESEWRAKTLAVVGEFRRLSPSYLREQLRCRSKCVCQGGMHLVRNNWKI